MAWYRTGTVSVTAASTTVTGSGTAFVANARVGDAFIGPDGRLYEISNVASDTAISILPAYKGSTASGQGYAIAPVQGYVKKLADEASELLNEYGAVGTAAFADAVTSTSDTTANRLLKVGALLAQLGADVYGRANIVGTVSQSGGVPTGAVIQRGSNPNGTFERWADGSMTCVGSVTSVADVTASTSLAGGFRSGTFGPFSLPSSFINAGYSVFAKRVSGDSAYDFTAAPSTNSSLVFIGQRVTSGTIAAGVVVSYVAFGYWF